MNPSNLTIDPLALKEYTPFTMSIAVTSSTQEDIWLAINLFHINVYNLYCSGLRFSLAISGVISTLVGLIAS
ncbi:hypothetical protein SDC9_162877 [bioreactor metagenome]|uniref:Uncharacterized protein n=1 Tax=bioreactor metagenome TaxID=1076179 RepID=A0A645FTX4_9ZZZZ